MRTYVREAGLCCWILVVTLCGCEKTDVNSPTVMAVKDKLALMSSEVERGSPVFGSRKEIAEVENLIHGVVDLDQRRKLVKDYGRMLLSVELAHPPYQRWENASFGYFSHLENVIRVMRECGCPSRQILETFFSGLIKFKDACLSVPSGPKKREESLQEFSWRGDCARKLKEEYAQRMSEIRRFWLPYLDRRLPVDSHGEFKERIAPFLLIK